jgi:hypothetical protein
VADDGLHDQSSKGGGQPEDWNLVGPGAKVLVDGAHVGHLQSPAKLNTKKTEAHIPDLPEGFSGPFHVGRLYCVIKRIRLWLPYPEVFSVSRSG